MINTGQAALDQAARLCLKARWETQRVNQQLRYGNVPAARERLNDVDAAARQALQQLLQAGAARPTNVPAPASAADPLRAMAQADTPNACELLGLLSEAVAVAERVDKERGNVLPDDFALQPGESQGTDLAETLSGLALRLKIEVEGPADRWQTGTH